MRKLSVIIPCFNEREHIVPLLESLQWADERLVVDSFSTDGTAELAAPLASRVLQRNYQGPAEQKNWAIEQAQYEWILILDADERLSESLKQAIQQLLQQPEAPSHQAYWIKRRNQFMGHWVRYSGWQGDKVLRFFKKGQCRYGAQQVHEEMETKGSVGKLKGLLLHYTYKDLNHYLDKTRRYARWSAQDKFQKTKQVGYFHLYLKPLFRFFKHFLWRGGFLDGKVGLIVSALMAWGVFLRYVYLREWQRAGKSLADVVKQEKS